MSRVHRSLLVGLLLLVPVASSGCGSSGAASIDAATVATAVVIDVRTPEEFAAGHLEGALNIPVESGDFASVVSGLDPSLTYIVYCRSGRRSAVATEQMVAAGFSEVIDLGSLDNAASQTGLSVTT